MHYFTLCPTTNNALLLWHADRHPVNIAETQKLNCVAIEMDSADKAHEIGCRGNAP